MKPHKLTERERKKLLYLARNATHTSLFVKPFYTKDLIIKEGLAKLINELRWEYYREAKIAIRERITFPRSFLYMSKHRAKCPIMNKGQSLQRECSAVIKCDYFDPKTGYYPMRARFFYFDQNKKKQMGEVTLKYNGFRHPDHFVFASIGERLFLKNLALPEIKVEFIYCPFLSSEENADFNKERWSDEWVRCLRIEEKKIKKREREAMKEQLFVFGRLLLDFYDGDDKRPFMVLTLNRKKTRHYLRLAANNQIVSPISNPEYYQAIFGLKNSNQITFKKMLEINDAMIKLLDVEERLETVEHNMLSNYMCLVERLDKIKCPK